MRPPFWPWDLWDLPAEVAAAARAAASSPVHEYAVTRTARIAEDRALSPRPPSDAIPVPAGWVAGPWEVAGGASADGQGLLWTWRRRLARSVL